MMTRTSDYNTNSRDYNMITVSYTYDNTASRAAEAEKYEYGERRVF